MFGPSGHLYVYFTYGMHYCMNVVCGPSGQGSAVLIRAVEPLMGEAVMTENRRGRGGVQATNGPAKVCQAFGIDKSWNGHDLHRAPFRLVARPPLETSKIVQTTRVGIRQAADVPWRFYEAGNAFVSRLR
jgi:DNA-3-methyladenine glycosylase